MGFWGSWKSGACGLMSALPCWQINFTSPTRTRQEITAFTMRKQARYFSVGGKKKKLGLHKMPHNFRIAIQSIDATVSREIAICLLYQLWLLNIVSKWSFWKETFSHAVTKYSRHYLELCTRLHLRQSYQNSIKAEPEMWCVIVCICLIVHINKKTTKDTSCK